MSQSLLSVCKRSSLLKVQILAVFFLCLGTVAHSQCAAPANAIVAENCQAGNSPNEWDVRTSDAGDETIQGFATDISVNQGGTIYFKIDTPVSAYTINIYRMGYYGGLGARKVATISPSVSLPQSQPDCMSDSSTGLTDCGNWAVSASWHVPTTATSGIYFAHLIRTDTGGDSHIVFVVRNDSSSSAILYKTADESWQAYNYYGSGSFYGPNVDTFYLPYRAYKVSYNRPVFTRGFQAESNTWVFGAEFPMVEWLEQNGYDVTYSTGIDAARNGTLFKNHKIVMDCGHDEYISGPERATLQAARDAGVNLAFFSGNEMFWKTRLESSIDGTGTPNRTLVCYKETLAFAKLDPQDPPTWTGTWRDPTFSPPADGGKPENALTGTLFEVNGGGADDPGNLTIQVPQSDGQMRFWRNTAAATLAPGAAYTLVTGSLGFEWDIDADNGARPAGAFRLSSSTYQMTTDLLLDYGGTYGGGPATHHMMMYRAPSGALVFGAGTVNWSWGLNINHDNPFNFNNPNPDPNMQQAVVNLFADMKVQPTTLGSGLVPAIASTDTAPPQSVIVTPSSGSNINAGNSVTVMGTATDAGGVVAGVEVSGDGGATWHPASGRASWSYAWTPTVVGSTTLLSRAVDDSGNLETPNDAVPLNVAPQVCPCTIFQPSSVPNGADSGDTNAIEVGVKFRADADGSVIGVRFYKAATNTGTHVGHIWSSGGALLGTATFTSESATGWQQVNFAAPIAVTANTTYVVSYFSPSGHYAADTFTFQQAGVDDPPLHALANGVDGQNGVYFYGPSGGFPVSSYNASNYWVDVVYTSSNTYGISGNITGNGGVGATVTLTGTENLSTTSDASGNYSFDGIVNGNYVVAVSNPGVTYTPSSQPVTISYGVATGINFTSSINNPLSISGTLTGGAGATVSLSGPTKVTMIADASGHYSFAGLLNGSYLVTPSETGYIFQPEAQVVNLSGANATAVNFSAQVCTCISIWPSTAAPVGIDSGDTNSVEVGLKFRADASAYVTGIRFYKASTNTGTHTGHIWDASGNQLSSVTFVGETASGWQQATLTTPLLVQANTTYVVSYLAPIGHYSADLNYFATAGVDSPPLHALAEGVDGSNGVYLYTATGAFPTNTYKSTNYWVDVVYAAQPYTISGTIAGGGGAGATVSLNGTRQATTTADANGNYTFTNVFGGNYAVVPSSTGFVFIPNAQSVTISQSNVAGVNFTTPQNCPCDTIWPPSATPALIDATDPNAVEVGVKVRADSDGYILGVRFYKAGTNTGVHVGNLWTDSATSTTGGGGEGTAGSAPGSLIATASFANETASGWQQVLFSNPVPVVANTSYIASYFAPAGHYSADSNAFTAAGVDTPPLHALQQGIDGGNGVFAYSQTSALPTSSYEADNYWVDVIYSPASTYTVGGTMTGPGATGTTMVLSGAANAKTVTDANGNYSFGNLANGIYTVTPSGSTLTFSPNSQTVTVNNGHQLNANFASGVPTFAVSGQVGGAPGIPVVLSGPTSTTVQADGNGNFVFPAVVNGNYTVTPASPGYLVSPASQSFTVSGVAVNNLNFSATVVTYSVSGTIAGGPGAIVNLVGATTTTTTADATGNYNFANVTVGTYTLVPSMTGVVFTPQNLTVVLNGSNVTNANFAVPQNCPCDTIWPSSSTPATVDLGDANPVEVGVKFRADADAYIIGVRFFKATTNVGTHAGHLWSSSGTLLATATFTGESSGGWQQVLFSSPVPVQANTTYVASYFAPSGHYAADTYYFTTAGVDSPPLHALADGVDGPNGVFTYTPNSFPNQNFNDNATNYWVDVVYTPSSTYTVAGTISGAGGPGATVALSGGSIATTTADPSGNFSFGGLSNGSYVVTPGGTAYSYTPATLSAIVNSAHVLGLNFASSGSSFTISGNISGPGGSGATVTLGGTSMATATADASGNYSFPGLPSGSYTVAVANSGFVFTPPSQQVSVNGANAKAAFSSAAQTYTLSGTISGAGGPGSTVNLTGTSSATATADGSGNFTFANLANGGYTVTASNAGYVFTPPSQSVTINGANATTTFSSAAATYTLSGTISGAGGVGATVVLTGAANATVFANSSGAFAFPGLLNGAYTVTVSNAGYVFTPASRSVSVSGANAGAAFSSVAATYTLSGTISGTGGGGATVTLSGAASSTVVANGSGVFSFSGLLNGAYTVAVSKTGYVFTPASQSVSIGGANTTANFSVTLQTYAITGTVSGPGGAGATITLSGAASAGTVANASGVYSFPGLANGNYTVAVGKAGYVFTPASATVTVNGANASANFSSAAQTYAIAGTISGSGGPGATVTLTGLKSATTTADTSGKFTFSGLLNGTYTVAVARTAFVFTPASQSVTLSGSNASISFTSVAQTYTVSGTISGPGGAGAAVSLTGATAATVTASSGGVYSFTGLANGSYAVSPSRTGFAFSPASQAVTVNGANSTVNFGSAATYTVSGTISGAGGPGAKVALGGAANLTTTAGTSGTYSFTGLPNGGYTITPTAPGYAYTPAQRSITVNGGNLTSNFTSVALTYTISGTLSGSGASGTIVTLSGTSSGSTTTNSSGGYSFTGRTNGTYTVTPSRSGYVYSPASRSVTVVGSNATANFSGVVQTYSLSGTISGAGGAGAVVTLSGAATATATANSSGVFSFSGLPNGEYMVTPKKTGHSYSPSFQLKFINAANVTGVNFTSR